MANLNPIIIDHPFHEDYTATGILMTTPVKIIASHQRYLAKEGFLYMRSLVRALDYFDPASEISALNRAERSVPIKISPLLYAILLLCSAAEKRTHGIFRVDFQGIKDKPEGKHGFILPKPYYIEMKKDCVLNLGGIAKGFIVDKTYWFLKKRGARNIMVDAGGDIRIRSETKPWRIGLVNPLNTSNTYGRIDAFSGAVVSSGISERSIIENGTTTTHFFDVSQKRYLSKTPYISVTVQGHFAAGSEVYAKCLLMGEKLTLPRGYKAVGVTSDLKVHIFD